MGWRLRDGTWAGIARRKLRGKLGRAGLRREHTCSCNRSGWRSQANRVVCSKHPVCNPLKALTSALERPMTSSGLSACARTKSPACSSTYTRRDSMPAREPDGGAQAKWPSQETSPAMQTCGECASLRAARPGHPPCCLRACCHACLRPAASPQSLASAPSLPSPLAHDCSVNSQVCCWWSRAISECALPMANDRLASTAARGSRMRPLLTSLQGGQRARARAQGTLWEGYRRPSSGQLVVPVLATTPGQPSSTRSWHDWYFWAAAPPCRADLLVRRLATRMVRAGRPVEPGVGTLRRAAPGRGAPITVVAGTCTGVGAAAVERGSGCEML